jgi:hypothetical protein
MNAVYRGVARQSLPGGVQPVRAFGGVPTMALRKGYAREQQGGVEERGRDSACLRVQERQGS